ncbi:MAG TPA: hypothetical protein VMT93_07420 [Gemmatimonadaceae bacterium]|nr:hypothetical protein [Gemmatimonadaceae bacterium]
MTSSSASRATALIAAALLAACGHGDSSATQPVTPCANGSLVTLDTMQAVTLRADSANCLDMEPGTGTYVIVPQFADTAADSTPVAFEVGALGAASAEVVQAPAASRIPAADATSRWSTARAFDRARRAQGRALAKALADDPATRWRISAALAAAPGGVLPALGSTRVFSVCGDLNCASFKKDTAVLKYIGANVMLYQSQNAPAPPNGFSDSDIAAFGAVFDQTLYPIDANAFAAPSDIDGNGHEIVLLTPKVNALVTKSACSASGYVAGFFFPGDLIPSYAGGNDGEIYYSIAPDPTGAFSCAHSIDDVKSVSGGTFLHETLHMINFGQKVLLHGLPDTEREFLDEGMAHIAEEMGSKHYEALYPPPSGRTDPSQLFPDSAEGYISGDLYNSYTYLLAPNAGTATTTIPNGSTLDDSGAEWLFLRWLGDQRGEAIFGNIVRSALVGQANLEAQAGASLATLFGQASLAFYADSLPNVPRSAIGTAYHFSSRNLRVLFNRLYTTSGGSGTSFPRPYPILPVALAAGTTLRASMLKGGMSYYRFDASAASAATRVHFAEPGGLSFPNALGAQVTVLRCGSAAECQ